MAAIRKIIYLTIMLLLIGCGPSMESRISQIKSQNPQWGQNTVQQVADGKVMIGMTEEMVLAILRKPYGIKDEGNITTWVYIDYKYGPWGGPRPVPIYFVSFQDKKVLETRGDQRRAQMFLN